MKKKLRNFYLFAAAVIFFTMLFSVDVRAQENDTIRIADTQQDSSSEISEDMDQFWCTGNFKEMICRLLEREDIGEILETGDEDVKAAFLDERTEEELYQILILYRYSIVDGAAQGYPVAKDKEAGLSDLKEWMQMEIGRSLEFYQELSKRVQAVMSSSITGSIIENGGTDNQHAESGNEENEETEGGQAEEGRSAEDEHAEIQQTENGQTYEQKAKLWEENAFRIFKQVVLEANRQPKEQSQAEKDQISDFDSYIEFQTRTSGQDMAELIHLLEAVEHAGEEHVQQALSEASHFLYLVYGIEADDTGDETAKEEDLESLEDPESKAKEGLDERQKKERAAAKAVPGNNLPALASASGAGVTYRASCQTTGWQGWSSNGGSSGTAGSQKRVEALQVKVTGNANLGITYQAHVQSKGWMNWAANGATAGTTGQSLRMEAVRMKLTGQSAGSYDLYYRAYCESYGWLDWAKNGQTAGTVNISKRIEALQIILTGKGAAAPGATKAPLKTNAVVRVGSRYFTTFNSAFDAMPSGGTLYVIRNCEATHIVTEKSFSAYPEEQNVKVSFRETHIEPAGIICTPTGRGSPTWTLGGNEGYTLTLDACKKGGSGVLSTHAGTVNLKSGVRLTNALGNGVWNAYGTTNLYDGAWIYGNASNGIAAMGHVNIYGGKIYGNSYNGVQSEQTIRLMGGEIYGNRKSGIHVGEGSCTFVMTGGVIHDNEYGVENSNGQGAIQISAGNIYSNKLDGVYTKGRQMTIGGSVEIHNNGRTGVAVNGGTAAVTGGRIYANAASGIVNKSTLNLSGGEIYSNTAENGGGILNSGTLTKSGGSVTGNRASNVGGGICILPGGRMNLSGGTVKSNTAKAGKGVYHNGAAMNMSGNGAVSTENDVFLCAGKFVSVTGKLNAQPAAVLTPSNYANGRKAAECLYDKKMGSTCFQKFNLTANGVYRLRPGDYQVQQSKAADQDIVLSTGYTVHFNKNYDGTVQNIPADLEKYWYEPARLPALTPSAPHLKFRGWSENADADKAEYQPGNEVNASINRKITLYAVWGTKIKVTYVGNRNVPGEERAEYVTLKDCMANQGYTIRKNAEFTKFKGDHAAFAGWDIKPEVSAKKVRFPETQTNRLTFEQLLNLAAEQQGEKFSSGAAVQEIRLYAAWDEFPAIAAAGVLEFYEGTEVTKEMLLSNVTAKDREDGSLTSQIKITQVEYADGKLADGDRQKGKKNQWKDDMPQDYQLDTWFMQMAEEDSPVVHKITYNVTDSFGNKTSYVWTVNVRYNEFPEIQAEDRYFTLEEARGGTVTKKTLLEDAVKEGRITVSDKEEDELYPGTLKDKIELLHFHEEDFKSFEDSGYVVVTYAVKDSMGPEGEGKETFRQCTVHVIKDGEVAKPEDPRYVRFINQDHYEQNLDGRDNQNGGLHADSRWYQDPEYKETITAAWQEEKACEETWTFSRKDVEEVKKYVKEHGIGNSREENALTEFAYRFGDKKK